jgi:hypothetical protein
MPKFKIPVSWTMIADMEIEADDWETAVKIAEEASLPEGEYCDSSFEINYELIDDSEEYGLIKPEGDK